MRLTLAALALVLLAGCGGGDGLSDADRARLKADASSTPPAAAPLVAQAAVVTVDTLGNGCEFGEDSGLFKDLHVGGDIVLKGADGQVVDTSLLAPPDIDPGEDLCAWSATFDAVPAGKGPYTAKVGAWSSDPVAEDDLDSTRLVITAD